MVAALLLKGDEILIQQRKPGGSRGLLWEFPGGKVEPGESDAQALIRECREELDVTIAVDALAWSCLHQYADLEVELLLYRCRWLSGEYRCLDAHAIRFEARKNLAALPFCEADIPLVGKLISGEI